MSQPRTKIQPAKYLNLISNRINILDKPQTRSISLNKSLNRMEYQEIINQNVQQAKQFEL